MKASPATAVVIFLMVGLLQSVGLAAEVFSTDFGKGDFAALGWKAEGAWDAFVYRESKTPKFVARFKANEPDGRLTRTFGEIKAPKKLALSLETGWGWGDVGQGADSITFMLLDAKGNGYVFDLHRVKAKWAVQWAKVAGGKPPKDKVWASEEIDATQVALMSGGALNQLTITREASGAWSFASKDWNKGAGGAVKFTDTTTTSFSQLVLLGTKNFDEQVFGNIELSAE